MSLSIEHLKSLLEEDARERQQEREARKRREASHKPLQRSVQEALRSHGLLPPMTGCWVRPIPDMLFRCPLSVSQTTLATWSSLPHSIRSKLPSRNIDDGIVEVPLSYIEIDEEVTGGPSKAEHSTVLKQRPLAGNLTSKLSEYTRGIAGQCRPFRAGGLGKDDDEDDADEVDGFLSETGIHDSLQVLKKGSELSWNDGTILTAPPGVDFKVGLSWQDVHGGDQPQDGIAVQNFEPGGSPAHKRNVEEKTVSAPSEIKLTQNFKPLSSAGMWSDDYFDDDSLFGSREKSESESGSDDDDEQAEDAGGAASPDDTGSTEQLLLEQLQRAATVDTDQPAHVSTDPSDVDELLADLSFTEDDTPGKKSKSILANNPLELAERHSKDQQNSERKDWANTKLLPIDDISAWIPNPAMKFPFTLDAFQQQAIVRLERNESVFVAAHTSAGKTVVAEYAVALAKQRATRCVYTSPIKALSNQKFRDFSLKFGAKNVGLITGDMQLNADDSTCIIMTTEILRSMLYRGADLIRDIEWVIFDEVHYINDTERGVVWEEVIIMLPSYVNLIFLSATTPNTLEFSDWIGRTKRKPVHVIKTDYRPVPLSHHLWAGLKLHKIMEGKSGFLEKGYSEASKILLPKSAKEEPGKKRGQSGRPPTGGKQLAWQAQGTKNDWMSLIRFLDREFLTPTIVFSFSKKKCEEIANMLRSLDLNTAAERGLVKGFTLQTIARLSQNDATLPQVATVCEMVQRGIGVHHGGLLPILKEMVEILFSRNLIKVLFATETFAIGVNMPARAVVFNSIRKHDGTQFRGLEPGEYTQMAGRAGRRGLDAVGTVILCAFGTEPPPLAILRNMLTGQSTMLSSQFRLTYNMILNLLRVEEMSVEGMIKRSFSEFATQRALTANEYPKLLARGTRTLTKLDESFQAEADLRVGAEDLEEYFMVCSQLQSLNSEILNYAMEATNGIGEGILATGRIVLLTSARQHGLVRSPALVLRASARKGSTEPSVVCMALLPESYVPPMASNNKTEKASMPAAVGFIGSAEHRFFKLCDIKMDEIVVLTGQKHKISVKDLLREDGVGGARSQGTHDVFAAVSTAGRKSDLNDPFSGMKALGTSRGADKALGDAGSKTKGGQARDQAVKYLIDAESVELASGLSIMDLKDCARCGGDVVEFRQRYGQMESIVPAMRSCSSHRHPTIEKLYVPLERKETLRTKVERLRHLLSNESLRLFPDFLQRKAVLRKLGYIDENETVAVKGRVACEVNTCDELIVTEMVFEGLLNDLDPAEIVAALSSLVFQEKSGEEELDVELPETLRSCCYKMRDVALNLGQLQKNQGLELDPLEFVDGALNFGLVHVVYEWALGVPFSKICELTLVQEGSIVRCITRLDELCREVRNCARVVGNPTLYRKMEAASVAIKRDIVFASSLYVS